MNNSRIPLSAGDLQAFQQAIECDLCHNTIGADVVVLSCGCSFCRPCCFDSVDNFGTRKCPACSWPAAPLQLRPVPLLVEISEAIQELAGKAARARPSPAAAAPAPANPFADEPPLGQGHPVEPTTPEVLVRDTEGFVIPPARKAKAAPGAGDKRKLALGIAGRHAAGGGYAAEHGSAGDRGGKIPVSGGQHGGGARLPDATGAACSKEGENAGTTHAAPLAATGKRKERLDVQAGEHDEAADAEGVPAPKRFLPGNQAASTGKRKERQDAHEDAAAERLAAPEKLPNAKQAANAGKRKERRSDTDDWKMVETGDRTPDWDVSTGALQDQATDEASSGLDGLGVDEYDVSVADLKEAGAGGDGYERQVIQWINELDERIAKHCDALTQKSLVFRPDRTPVLTQPMSPEKTPKLAFPQRNPFRLHVPSSTPNHSLTPSTNPTSHELPFKPDLLTHPAPIPPSPDELLEAPEHPIALAQPRAAARALSLSDRCQQQPSTNPERGTPPHLDTPTATPATPEHKAYPLTPPATEASGLRGGVGGGAFTVTTSGLSADERIMVETRCHELSNVRYVEACELTDDVNVLITSDPAPRTVKYCLSLVRGLWIVAVGWLTHPTETSLPNYEVQGDSGKGAEKSRAPTLARWAKKARVAGEGQFTSPFDGLPKPALLLEGSAVSLVGPFRALSEETVAGLCAEAGAVVVQRYDPASRLKHIAICEARERLQAANDAADHRAPSRRAMALRTLLACICRWAPDL